MIKRHKLSLGDGKVMTRHLPKIHVSNLLRANPVDTIFESARSSGGGFLG